MSFKDFLVEALKGILLSEAEPFVEGIIGYYHVKLF